MNRKIMKALYALLCIMPALAILCGHAAAREVKPVKAKNIIYYVADGAGPNTLGLLLNYARYAPGSIYADRASNLEKFMREASLGLMLTNSKRTLVNDSAASATQFASGRYSLPGRIGVDYEGNNVSSSLAKAKRQGKSIGLVTTTHIQDATPAAFAAHQITRKNLEEISADFIKSGADIILGGGKKYFPQNLIDEARANGYQFAFNKKELAALSGKIIGLFGEESAPYAIERNTVQPSLTEMAKKALSELEKNKKGFAALIEAGKTDWAAHDNDAGLLLHELMEFDNTLAELVRYVKKNKDTLLIVLADHETGGFGFNYRKETAQDDPQGVFGGSYYVTFDTLDTVYKQNKSYRDMDAEYKALPAAQRTAAALAQILSNGLARNIPADFIKANGGDIFKVKAALDKRDGITWATDTHLSTPVLVMSYFNGKETGYAGLYHTTDLGVKVMRSLGVK